MIENYFDKQFKTLLGAKIAVFLKRIYDWHMYTREGCKILVMRYHIYKWLENPDRYVIHGRVHCDVPRFPYIPPTLNLETGQIDLRFNQLANDQDFYFGIPDNSHLTDGQREADCNGALKEIQDRYYPVTANITWNEVE